jgi:hypothetical protein
MCRVWSETVKNEERICKEELGSELASEFYISLTVHLGTIRVNNKLDASKEEEVKDDSDSGG